MFCWDISKFKAILFTSIGRWRGTNPVDHTQVEIDMIAEDSKEYLICECKWKNEKLDLSVLKQLKEKANVFSKNRKKTWFVLFSKSGFTDALIEEAKKDFAIMLVDLKQIMSIIG